MFSLTMKHASGTDDSKPGVPSAPCDHFVFLPRVRRVCEASLLSLCTLDEIRERLLGGSPRREALPTDLTRFCSAIAPSADCKTTGFLRASLALLIALRSSVFDDALGVR